MGEWDETPRTDDEPTRRMPETPSHDDAPTQSLGAAGLPDDTRPQPAVEAPPQQPPYIPDSEDDGRWNAPDARSGTDGWRGRGGDPRGRNPFAIVAAILAVALVAVIAFQVGSCSAAGQAAPSPSTGEPAQAAPTSPSAKSESPETDDPGDSADNSADNAGDETLGALAGDALDKLGSIDVGEAKTQLSEGAKNLAGSAASLLDRFANS